jgi:2-polyprenyl-3-methyl-5-hydroxy-6-metoxy-1,4-benzoquinol methylase
MDAISTAASDAAPGTLRLARAVVALYAPLGPLTQLYVLLRLIAAPMIATARLFPAAGEILDLGCGYGIFAHLLLLANPRRRIVGIDVSPSRIEAARRVSSPHGGPSFQTANAHNFPKRRFPVIALIDLLHHMSYEEQITLLRLAVGALEEGGTIIVKDLETRPRWKYWVHMLQDRLMYRWQRLYFRPREEMTGLLERMGLVVSVHPLASWRPHPHIVYRCRRKGEP